MRQQNNDDAFMVHGYTYYLWAFNYYAFGIRVGIQFYTSWKYKNQEMTNCNVAMLFISLTAYYAAKTKQVVVEQQWGEESANVLNDGLNLILSPSIS